VNIILEIRTRTAIPSSYQTALAHPPNNYL